jgi:hypothetical protein
MFVLLSILLGFTELWMLHILAPHFVFCVPYQAWDEGFTEIAKMDREGCIIASAGEASSHF